MFSLLVTFIGLSLTQQVSGRDFGWDLPQRFVPKIREVYIPAGFDDNDMAQVIVEFELRNTCEELGPVYMVPHEEYPQVLQIHAEAFRSEGPCMEVSDNPIRAVDLGKLPAGEYEIRNFKDLKQKYGDLRVRKAGTARIDESVYAPVDSLILSRDPNGLRRYITLAGMFSNDCMAFVQDQVRIARTASNLIEVLPVVAKINRDDCQERDTPFLETYALPEPDGERGIKPGRYLFHVRIMDRRKSFNKIDVVE